MLAQEVNPDILLISPYHSGSHAAWADGYAAHSQLTVQLLTLPGQLWKWRMQGAAVTLARQFNALTLHPNLILADGMLDVATFAALTRRTTADIPIALYMHENQLTYPLPEEQTAGPMRRNWGVRERAYGLINWKAMLAADRIFFNSHHHLESWFEALPRFLKHYRDYNELATAETLRHKSAVLPVGLHLQRFDTPATPRAEPPLILWNQRWEFDKNPAAFFNALYHIKAEQKTEQQPFRLAVCGENFQQEPAIFNEARHKLAPEIIHFGYATSQEYIQLLQQADVVISTAKHEFFGISILEAIYAGAMPLLPHRLSYPELIPTAHHATCLYRTQRDLQARLRWALAHPQERQAVATALHTAVAVYDWRNLAPVYDQTLQYLTASFSAR